MTTFIVISKSCLNNL